MCSCFAHMNSWCFYHSIQFDDEALPPSLQVRRAHGSMILPVRPIIAIPDFSTPTRNKETEQQVSSNKPIEQCVECNQVNDPSVSAESREAVASEDPCAESSVDSFNQTNNQLDSESSVDSLSESGENTTCSENEESSSSERTEPSSAEAASLNNWEEPCSPFEGGMVQNDSRLQNQNVLDDPSQIDDIRGQNSFAGLSVKSVSLPKAISCNLSKYLGDSDNGRAGLICLEKLITLKHRKGDKLYPKEINPVLSSTPPGRFDNTVRLLSQVGSKPNRGLYIDSSAQYASGGEGGGLPRQLQDVDDRSSGLRFGGHDNMSGNEREEGSNSENEEERLEENQGVQSDYHPSQPASEDENSPTFPSPIQEKSYSPDSSCPVSYSSLLPMQQREREPPDTDMDYGPGSHMIVASSFPSQQLPYGSNSTFQPSGLIEMKKLPHQELALIAFGAKSFEMLAPDVRLEYSSQVDLVVTELLNPQQASSMSQVTMGMWKFRPFNRTQAFPLNEGSFPWIRSFNTCVELEPD